MRLRILAKEVSGHVVNFNNRVVMGLLGSQDLQMQAFFVQTSDLVNVLHLGTTNKNTEMI